MTKLKRIKVNEDIKKIIFYDLECLELINTPDNKYHYELLRNNLIDLFGYPKDNK
jgi:hypothetical protein